jgi:hypothetical protein
VGDVVEAGGRIRHPMRPSTSSAANILSFQRRDFSSRDADSSVVGGGRRGKGWMGGSSGGGGDTSVAGGGGGGVGDGAMGACGGAGGWARTPARTAAPIIDQMANAMPSVKRRARQGGSRDGPAVR